MVFYFRQIPPKIPQATQAELARELNLKTPLCYDKRIYVTTLSKEERTKHQQFTQKTILREEVSGGAVHRWSG